MPGKYSHSVVLAGYSSRGIIDLPNDQALAYLQSSPYAASYYGRKTSSAWSESSPNAQPRAQSALATVSRYTPDMGRNVPLSRQRQVIIDDGADVKVITRHAPGAQRPSTSDRSFPPMHQSKQPNMSLPQHTIHTRTTVSPLPETSATLFKSVPSDVRYGAFPARTEMQGKGSVQVVPRMVTGPSVSVLAAGQPLNSNKPPTKLEPAIDMRSKSEFSTKNRHKANKSSQDSGIMQQQTIPQRKSSLDTQIHLSGARTTKGEYTGTLDKTDQPISYVTGQVVSSSPTYHRSPVQVMQQSTKIETPSPVRAPTRATEPKPKMLRASSIDLSDSEAPTEVTVSPIQSVKKPDSTTSMSTLGSRGTSKRTDVKKSATQPSAQEWRLPEIDEDGAFDANFFIQHQDDVISRPSNDGSVDSFLDRPLGTISAGRDVDFSKDDDQVSEVDAAFPPDIARFRDEESTSKPPVLQPKKSDVVLGMGAGSPTQTPQSKKSGFFARLRSKSRPRGRS